MVIAISKNEKGRKTYLTMRHDETGAEVWSAFVGNQGGNLRRWKTKERAEKEMAANGWQKIGERVLKQKEA